MTLETLADSTALGEQHQHEVFIPLFSIPSTSTARTGLTGQENLQFLLGLSLEETTRSHPGYPGIPNKALQCAL
ncbi:hypothetical protein BDP81DRAFT_413221 [Colletotrichum phormii]|uniref:Uncharacterized protein n=1 Tax=Colletotrichum phormii TaxID=359342 RepID=A0AAJ0A3C2_9PEZI|nr:uncharacterized protein BDP81DRAFT_413221 [Colletotrichum phormii]KAK1655708.1 hypothetical protein BDP81DRAFT_413221 [Colletotrichum phormii]